VLSARELPAGTPSWEWWEEVDVGSGASARPAGWRLTAPTSETDRYGRGTVTVDRVAHGPPRSRSTGT